MKVDDFRHAGYDHVFGNGRAAGHGGFFFVAVFEPDLAVDAFAVPAEIAVGYVFEGEESNGDKHTELASSVDLENPDQLPVKKVFDDAVMVVSQILPYFFISSHNLCDLYVFEVKKSIAGISTELQCSGDLENPGQLPVQKVLMIVSYEFLKFLHYLCFRG